MTALATLRLGSTFNLAWPRSWLGGHARERMKGVELVSMSSASASTSAGTMALSTGRWSWSRGRWSRWRWSRWISSPVVPERR